MPRWCLGRGFVLYAEMLEVAGYFTAVSDRRQNGHVAFAVQTFSHLRLEYLSEPFASAGVFKSNVLCTGVFD